MEEEIKLRVLNAILAARQLSMTLGDDAVRHMLVADRDLQHEINNALNGVMLALYRIRVEAHHGAAPPPACKAERRLLRAQAEQARHMLENGNHHTG